MILLGIMEFGRAYNTQVSLTNAAREGVRVMAIANDKTAAKNAVLAVNPAFSAGTVTFKASSPTGATTCGEPGAQMTVTVGFSLKTMTGIAGPFAMTGKGTMLCGG
jgi:Flp pilus assembly protein TadG